MRPLMNALSLTDSDKIAVSMLIIMFLALAVVGMLAYGIYRHTKAPRSAEDDLMDSVSTKRGRSDTSRSKQKSKTEPSKDWEKDGDWWKSENPN